MVPPLGWEMSRWIAPGVTSYVEELRAQEAPTERIHAAAVLLALATDPVGQHMLDDQEVRVPLRAVPCASKQPPVVTLSNKWRGKQRQSRAPSPGQTMSRGVQILN